jgi:ferredoxin-NADP reductase/Na+-translocating ferredoxin:NAD+ oxidoreductase RnfD subunit
MKYINKLLDTITMYRLLLYYLLALLGIAMAFGSVGVLSYSPIAIALSAAYVTFVCWVVNRLFAYLLGVPTNPESPLITGLILALIITPLASGQNIIFLSAAAGLAMASKYLLTIRGKHIFNPAAIAIVLTSLGAGDSASWWVGSMQLAPFVLVGGLLIARKIQRMQMTLTYFGAVAVATTVLAAINHTDVLATLQTTFLHSSALFLGFVMLTEPRTSPTRLAEQRWYAIVTGVLFPPQLHIFGLFSTPELTLVVGNIFSYIVSTKAAVLLRLKGVVRWGAVTDLVFSSDQALAYAPGQYLEFTLPHAKPDSRGSRRYFTLASSPTEDTLHIGVKFTPHGSTFKQAFANMHETTPFSAGQLGGDFTLPRDASQKLAFIAGGIGITPFRSMMKYLLDTNDPRVVTLLYAEKTAKNLAYTDVFEQARQSLDITTTYVLSEQTDQLPTHGVSGTITQSLIAATIPDYAERLFYLSGPHAMVSTIKEQLLLLGVKRHQIKTDFFPGY